MEGEARHHREDVSGLTHLSEPLAVNPVKDRIHKLVQLSQGRTPRHDTHLGDEEGGVGVRGVIGGALDEKRKHVPCHHLEGGHLPGGGRGVEGGGQPPGPGQSEKDESC